jgi:putative ABC transport system permease protein
MIKYYLILKLALSSIFSKKTRAFLTMLGIIIGVGSVIAIMSLGKGAESLITGSIKRIGTNAMSILPGASDEKGPPASAFGIVITTLSKRDAEEIAKIPHVTSVTAYSRGNGEISTAKKSIPADFAGVSESYPITESHQVQEGRFFSVSEERTSARVAVIGMDIKNELFKNESPVGKRIKINGLSFQIIGLMEKKGAQFIGSADNIVLVPLTTAQNEVLGTRHLNMIRLLVDTEDNVPIVKERIQRRLRTLHGIKNPDNDDFSVRSLAQALDVFTTITLAIRFFLASIASVSLLVGGIGITNIMLMTVKERTQEIGLRKALGAKPKDIANQFMIEAIILTVLGGILGIISGIAFSYLATILITKFGYNWVFDIPVTSIIISFFISAMIGLIFGVYPAKSASKLNPINSLRYE